MTRSLTGRTDRGLSPADRQPPPRTRRVPRPARPAGRVGPAGRARLGFSLLELIAVVTILGIIAAVVIPRITNSSTTAKQQADKQAIAEARNAIERHKFDHNSWPADLTELATDGYLHNAPVFQHYTLSSDATLTAGEYYYDSTSGSLTFKD